MFEACSKTPLPTPESARYQGVAYDGCHLYFTVRCRRAVLQLDAGLEPCACFPTCRPYAALCYDGARECFWAAAEETPSVIFRLNRRMEEIDRITVCDGGGRRRPVAGLSYRCCDQMLVVAFAGEIVAVQPDCPQTPTVLLTAGHQWFLGVLSLWPYLLCHCMGEEGAAVCIYSREGRLLHRVPIPCDAGVEGAVFWPRCGKEGDRIRVLCTRKGCYPYLCDYRLCSDGLCGCNYELCCCPKPGDPCADILESVALVETALAHILNAEGEKLQKVLASTDDVDQILKVNASVQKTMNKAIFLEQVLCSKLEQCCPDPKPPCP